MNTIKGRKIFTEIFTTSKKLYSDKCYCFVLFKNKDEFENDESLFSYAAIVKKKTAKKAVSRNRAKRLIRESLRSYLADNPNQTFLNSVKYLVIYWNKSIEHPKLLKLDEVFTGVNALMHKIENYYEQKIKDNLIEKINDSPN